ncbi:HDIG domain-containing metalloprotein [Candidatus Magnetomonas plexicatena]|uniref:HDIG domain-containing metalloprotein n=1 Tax=Candidatus Magnetomonas plexicatena TaxID=2552947 RepID=UPI001C791674|nr:HDIG domain-containing protein [Nitrospirales bacterium LBB_01]
MDEREIALLKAANVSDHVIEHSKAVSVKAVTVANQVKIPVNVELIRVGALLHDIGRGKTHGIDHAIVGAEMVRELGLGEDVAKIIERHIGAGLPKEEALTLGLPPCDYFPKTPEQKIVSYADNMTDGSKILDFAAALVRLKKILGDNHPAIVRFIAQHNEIMSWMET